VFATRTIQAETNDERARSKNGIVRSDTSGDVCTATVEAE